MASFNLIQKLTCTLREKEKQWDEEKMKRKEQTYFRFNKLLPPQHMPSKIDVT
jgi:hypothetical protein